MIKIIKYSITLIIFSIITSLFVFYFYLLKGLDLNNIHFNSINVGKLYIKIDKKIIIKAKNIYIKTNNNKKTAKIDFIDIKNKIKTYYKYLNYLNLIEIKNLNINNNKIDFISFQKHTLTIDNKDIFLNANINFKKMDININELNIKKYEIIIKDILMKLFIDKTMKINILTKYQNTDINLNINILNDLNATYLGTIYNLNDKLLTPFNIKHLNSLFIYNLKFIGDLNKVNFTFNKINLKIDKYNISTNKISGNFNIIKNILFIKNKKLNTKFDDTNIYLNNTKLNYNITKNNAEFQNKNISILNKQFNIQINNNHIKYDKNLIIDSKIIYLKHKLVNSVINNLHITYTNNIIKLYTPSITLKNKNIDSELKNINITYKNKIASIFIPKIITHTNQINTSCTNTTIYYKNNKVYAKIKNIFLKNKDIKGNIFTTNITYNIKQNDVIIKNNQINLKYKNIKHINLHKISTYFDINKNILNTNIPQSYINKINLKNINIDFKQNILKVIFYSNTLLSQKLNNILKTFGIHNSIHQANGKNKIKGIIKYNLNNKKLHTDIKIDVKNSKLMLTKTSFLDIKHSFVNLIDSNIYLKNTDLDYNISIVNINYFIQKGVIDLNKLEINTTGILKDLNVTNIIQIKNKPEDLYVDLKGIDIFLKKLNADVLIHKDIIVDINKLHNLIPYNNYLQEYNISDGKVKVIIDNGIKIISNITKTKQNILLNKLIPLHKLDINTSIKNGITSISNPKLKIKILDENNITKISGNYKNLDINITHFLDKNSSDNNSSTKIETHIKAKNSYILYNNLKLFSKKLSIDYNSSNAKIISLYKDRNITILYNDGEIKLYGLNIKNKTFKELTNTTILNQPLINLFAIKNKNSDILNGFIEIKKGYIKELKTFNNVLATINLIPSLITFQPAGFSSKGYKIKHGFIEYILYNNILLLKKIKIEGENITFNAKGYIDLNKKIINLDLDVNLIVKLVKDIPIINYILLGKDNGITINLSITGDLNNPTIHKNAISNIIMSPLGIIKRLLLTPFRPFMKEEK